MTAPRIVWSAWIVLFALPGCGEADYYEIVDGICYAEVESCGRCTRTFEEVLADGEGCCYGSGRYSVEHCPDGSFYVDDNWNDQRESMAWSFDAEGQLIGARMSSEDDRYCERQASEALYGDFARCDGVAYGPRGDCTEAEMARCE